MFFCDTDKPIEDFKDQSFTLMEWIQNIKQIPLEKDLIVGNGLNAYNCHGLVKALLNICNEFPLWSGLRFTTFQYITYQI